MHLNLDVSIMSIEVNGLPGDQTAAYGLPAQVRTQMPDIFLGRLQPDAPENGLPLLLVGAAWIENVRFVDLGGNRMGIAGEIVLGTAAGAVARAMLQSKNGGVPAPPSGVHEQNLQVGFGRWPVDGTLTLPPGGGPFSAVLLRKGGDGIGPRRHLPVLQADAGLRPGTRSSRYRRSPVRSSSLGLPDSDEQGELSGAQQDILVDAVSAIRVLPGGAAHPAGPHIRSRAGARRGGSACATAGDQRAPDRGFDPDLLLPKNARGNDERCGRTASSGPECQT